MTNPQAPTVTPSQRAREAAERMRAAGWSVGVHNDYRLNDQAHTFWLWTHPSGRYVKGEGLTDADALAQCERDTLAPAAQPEVLDIEVPSCPFCGHEARAYSDYTVVCGGCLATMPQHDQDVPDAIRRWAYRTAPAQPGAAEMVERAREDGRDDGATFCIETLARQLGVNDYEQCDGTEEWEGDVAGTLLNVLRAARVYDDEHGDIARLPDAPTVAAASEVTLAGAIDRLEQAVGSGPQAARYHGDAHDIRRVLAAAPSGEPEQEQ